MWFELTVGAAVAAFAGHAIRLHSNMREARRDQQKLERSSRVLEEERRVLELIAGGASLKQVLDALTRAIERMAADCFCTVLLLDEDGRRLLAGCGREALEVLSTASVDLVLMDIQMPEMDGFEATRCIRELEKSTGSHVPIVAMTAHAMQSDRDACLLAGMDGHIAKPVQSAHLYEAVDAVLSGSSHVSLAGR